jgi:hypothetical protein
LGILVYVRRLLCAAIPLFALWLNFLLGLFLRSAWLQLAAVDWPRIATHCPRRVRMRRFLLHRKSFDASRLQDANGYLSGLARLLRQANALVVAHVAIGLWLRVYGEEGFVNTIHFSITTNVLLMYASRSLKNQMDSWTSGRPEWQAEVSFERSLPAIRKLLRRVDAVLVDATEDPAQATDALLQAIGRLGTASVAMYTETAHDGLELFTRIQGSLFFLGPLSDSEWTGFFERLPAGKANPPIPRSSEKKQLFRPRVFE